MVKLLIFDLDGVLYTGDEPVPFAVESVNALRRRGFTVRFLTNNSSRTRAFYADKLQDMGFQASEDEMMSSASAARRLLLERSPGGARAFVIGEEGLYEELGPEFRVVGPGELETADYVVVGFDREFNYDKLADGLEALLAGAEFIATNLDATYPMPGGKLLPGGGSIVAALAAAAGREPVVTGKPNPAGIRALMADAGAAPEETLLIGDRPSTDMATAKNAGTLSCLVLTGVASPADALALPDDLKPDFIINDLRELASLDCLKDGGAAFSRENHEAGKES